MAPDLPLVTMNATLIDQVLTNLLENALKYTPAETPITVRVFHERSARGLPSIITVVRDYGPGIPADDLARIFEKFYRRGDTLTQAAGSGLGLAICKGIIEAHSGHIWAENCPGGGAAFTFKLPLGAAAQPNPASAAGSDGSLEPAAPAGAMQADRLAV